MSEYQVTELFDDEAIEAFEPADLDMLEYCADQRTDLDFTATWEC